MIRSGNRWGSRRYTNAICAGLAILADDAAPSTISRIRVWVYTNGIIGIAAQRFFPVTYDHVR
jgi:hypothetical protein